MGNHSLATQTSPKKNPIALIVTGIFTKESDNMRNINITRKLFYENKIRKKFKPMDTESRKKFFGEPNKDDFYDDFTKEILQKR